MVCLEMNNPFAAPVYYEDTVTSTMAVSRELAAGGSPHGTVITADYQSAGRGRLPERTWETDKGKSLACTVLLRCADISAIPAALTLRAGLAICLAIEDAFPVLKNSLQIKWPNDILHDSRKICGILCEADGKTVYAGIGVNVAQKEFPPHLRDRASSIAIACGADIESSARIMLLGKIIRRLYSELEGKAASASANSMDNSRRDTENFRHNAVKTWRTSLEARLYRKGERVTFIPGAAGPDQAITGILSGIGPDGELLLLPDGAGGAYKAGEADVADSVDKVLSFFSGELTVQR